MRSYTNIRFYVILSFLFVLLGCTNYKKEKGFIDDLVMTNNIDSCFNENKLIVDYFVDSILRDTKASFYFNDAFEPFKTGYSELAIKSSSGFKKYYVFYDSEDSTKYLKVTIVSDIGKNHASFIFKEINNSWKLYNLQFEKYD
jgi:hypothetical protein